MANWQLQEAKARLSELVKRAVDDGPQRITLRGVPAAVVLSVQAYERLRGERMGFAEMMRDSPLGVLDPDTGRDTSATRQLELL